MIKYVTGDLVKQAKDFEVIAHCCNCFCTFGAGIAPQIKNKFPEAFAVDCATPKGDASKLGTITYTVQQTTPVVVNLYGQYDFKKSYPGEVMVDYKALRSSLKLMKAKFSGKTFGLPMIGAGLAGGDWAIIEKIIEEEMRGEYVTIVEWIENQK
jgi:O-acetyl-ADP-ribose deacetylase (regulator of RNase III)